MVMRWRRSAAAGRQPGRPSDLFHLLYACVLILAVIDVVRLPHRLSFVWASLAIGLLGCGGDDSAVYQVRGEVRYEGKQVVSGTVMFQPDAGKTMIAAIQND